MNSICVNNQNLQVKEYKGEKVLTFKDIDNFHERVNGTAGRNFRKNKKFFVENIDFFELKGSDLKDFKLTTNFVASNTQSLILLTQTGYLMVVKSFTDDLSWEIQRVLVNEYFNKKEPVQMQLDIKPNEDKIYFDNIPVMTLKMIADFLNKAENQVRYYIKKYNLKNLLTSQVLI